MAGFFIYFTANTSHMRLKILWITLLLLAVISAILASLFLSTSTSFEQPAKFLYIRTSDATYETVLKSIKDSSLLKNVSRFDFIARKMDLPAKIKPGRYEIKKEMSLLDIVRLLKNGSQSPLNLVITKFRTRESFAGLVARKFEADSISLLSFMNNNDSLKPYGLDTNTVMAGLFPNTYQLFWNASPSMIFKTLFAEKEKFWTKEKIQLAESKKLTPITAYILASIVEEETRANQEKDTIASVYLNRYYKGMRLQADPTVKFALRDFGLKRIYEKHTAVESPYNTYRVVGLPPGPICTPSLATIEAVLRSPTTNYLYFVANSDYSGTHLFSETYEQHLKYAREFHEAQNEQEKIKAANEATGH